MTTRIVAIDGPGGAGKSSLAAYIARELDAPIIHTDDFASWENPVNWWPELIEKVLKPLAAGRPACYMPTSWGGPERKQVVVEPAEFVLLEGVTASRDAFRRTSRTRSGSKHDEMCGFSAGLIVTAKLRGQIGSVGWPERTHTSSVSDRRNAPTSSYLAIKTFGFDRSDHAQGSRSTDDGF
jgi:hypothetical protein